MKFSKGTESVLQSMSSINPSLLFPADSNTLMVMDASKSMFAKAEIKEKIEKGMAIYDVPQFLATLKMFGDYDLEPHEDFATIKFPENKSKMRYVFAHPNVVGAPPKELNMPEHQIQFVLEEDILKSIWKVAASSGMQNFVVYGKGGDAEVELKVSNFEASSTNESNNEWSVTIPASVDPTIGSFQVVFYINSMTKLIPRDYDVKLSSHKIGSFTAVNPSNDDEGSYEITYCIAMAIEAIFDGED